MEQGVVCEVFCVEVGFRLEMCSKLTTCAQSSRLLDHMFSIWRAGFHLWSGSLPLQFSLTIQFLLVCAYIHLPDTFESHNPNSNSTPSAFQTLAPAALALASPPLKSSLPFPRSSLCLVLLRNVRTSLSYPLSASLGAVVACGTCRRPCNTSSPSRELTSRTYSRPSHGLMQTRRRPHGFGRGSP